MGAKNQPHWAMLEIADQEAPEGTIDLWPSVQEHVTLHQTVVHHSRGEHKMKSMSRNVKILTPIALVLFLLAALVAFTPHGRALAETVIKFFVTTDQTSFLVPTVQPSVSSPDEQTYLLELVPVQITSPIGSTPAVPDQNCEGAALLTYVCRIKSAEEKVGFDAKEFPAVPQGVVFSNVEVNAAQGEIKITYEVIGGGGWIDLRQGIGDISDGLWGRVPAEAVEAVLIGDLPGEYVQGIYTSDGSGEATWNPNAGSQRLRWQDGERWFSIEKNGDPYPIEYLGREEMLALATTLVDDPQQSESQLRAEYLTSVTDAETLSGIDLMEPTLLPIGFSFSFAQYDAQTHSIRLVFNPQSTPHDAELFIMETPLEYAEPSEDGYYEGEDYWTLSWSTNDLYITIFFTSSQASGGQLDEASMSAIAESMR